MGWPPHITVAVVAERDGRFLVVEEKIKGERVINQPAGHLEPGETLFAAAERETLEETGWRVELTGVTGIYQYRSEVDDILYHRIAFAAKPLLRTGRSLDPDISAVKWLTLDEINERKQRSPLVLATIMDSLSGRIAPLDFIRHVN